MLAEYVIFRCIASLIWVLSISLAYRQNYGNLSAARIGA